MSTPEGAVDLEKLARETAERISGTQGDCWGWKIILAALQRAYRQGRKDGGDAACAFTQRAVAEKDNWWRSTVIKQEARQDSLVQQLVDKDAQLAEKEKVEKEYVAQTDHHIDTLADRIEGLEAQLAEKVLASRLIEDGLNEQIQRLTLQLAAAKELLEGWQRLHPNWQESIIGRDTKAFLSPDP